MTQRTEENIAGHLGEIRFEKERQTLVGVGKQARAYYYHQKQDKEGGHHELGCFLDAIAYTMDNDEMGDQENGHGPEYGSYWRCHEIVEVVHYISGVSLEFPHNGGVNIIETPAGHYGVVTRDEITREHFQIAHPSPCRTVGQLGVGSCGVGSASAPDDEFANHTGNAEHQDARDIYQDEGRSTIFAGKIGKTPDVSQAYSRASRCQYDTKPAAKVRSTSICHNC